MAGLDEEVELKKNIEGKMKRIKGAKYKFVSAHTARRSFATKYYLETDANIYDLMSITGHTTEKQFLNYIHQNRREPMKSFVKAINKRFI